MAQGLSTSGAVGIVVEGLPELKAAFERLGTRGSRVAARKGLAAGLKPITNRIRANSRAMVQRKTGLLAKSVGGRQKKNNRKGIYEAISGFNIGGTKAGFRTTKSGKRVNTKLTAPHAAFIGHGTAERYTEQVRKKDEDGNYYSFRKHARGAYRGRVKRNLIVPNAFAQSKSEALAAMKAKTLQSIKEETIKARARSSK